MKVVEKRENGTIRVHTINKEPSKTDQQWLKSSDVNNIMAKALRTGELSNLSQRQGLYADMSDLPDLLTALTTVTKANETFETVPAHIRKRFNNKPEEMISFLQDPENDREAVKLGLKEQTRPKYIPPVDTQDPAVPSGNKPNPQPKKEPTTTT